MIANGHQAFRERLVKVLEPQGHTFVVCSDGDEVRSAIADGLPDLVIADVNLPGLDAFELAELLRAGAQGNRAPLIVAGSGTSSDEGDESELTWMGLAAEPEALREMVQARLSTREGPAAQGTILVVDDDPSIQIPLGKRLTMSGYRVLSASDGEEGLERLAEGPDLVLCDVDMPKLDGFGFLERKGTVPKYREIPVIMMTAQARGAAEASRGLELGASDYVRKPFDSLELLSRVQTQLRIREANRLATEKQRDLAVIELAGAAAHEINNPLSVLMARLELILEDMSGDNPMHEELKQIERLSRRIAGVVEKMGHVRRYQVQHYCGGAKILDLDLASADEDEGQG
jgi:DNA-binding response OmpR family regulator